jgi:hypothetical protein
MVLYLCDDAALSAELRWGAVRIPGGGRIARRVEIAWGGSHSLVTAVQGRWLRVCAVAWKRERDVVRLSWVSKTCDVITSPIMPIPCPN